MPRTTQLVVRLRNKPGALTRVASKLAKARVARPVVLQARAIVLPPCVVEGISAGGPTDRSGAERFVGIGSDHGTRRVRQCRRAPQEKRVPVARRSSSR